MINNNHLISQSLNLLEISEKLNALIFAKQETKAIAENMNFNSLSINSRSIKTGDLYIAIRGDKFDGHDFAKEAMEKGAIACVVEQKIDHRVAVIEMGANHLKEIAYLAEIVKPDIAIVTNAGSAHIEGFGSLDKIAQGKGELYSSLSEQAYAVINNDDKYASYWKNQTNLKKENIHTFAIDNEADIVAKKNKMNTQNWSIVTAKDEFELSLPVPGKHNVLNAAAAVTVCKILDVSNEQIKQGLKDFKNVSGRLEINKKQKHFTLINGSLPSQ